MSFGTVIEYTIGVLSPLQVFWFADVCFPNFSWLIWTEYALAHIALGIVIKLIGYFKGGRRFTWAASCALILKEIFLDQHACIDPAIPIWLDSFADLGFVFLGFAIAAPLGATLGFKGAKSRL